MKYSDESFEEYLLSRIQDVVEEHEETSPTYHRMKEKYSNYYELAEEIADRLPHSEREIMMELFDMEFYIRAEEEFMIYQQGLRDGIHILKYLEVL